MSQQIRNTGANDLINLLKPMVVTVFILLGGLIHIQRIGMQTKVDGFSMYPTLSSGDRIYVDKRAYRKELPQRGDIVVFQSDESATGYFVKRVIGMPGEVITIDAFGILYIDGKPQEDLYGYGVMQTGGLATMGVKVNEGEYFVLGDNRNNSEDSRFPAVGNVALDKIVGKTDLRLFPIVKFGDIELYRERKEGRNEQE